jgi:Fe2+ transport system protein B
MGDLASKEYTVLATQKDAKITGAERELAQAEAEKVKAETEKLKAEFEQRKHSLEDEIQNLERRARKDEAFFQANKNILRYINIKERAGMRTMLVLYPVGLIIFLIISLITLPLTIASELIKSLLQIVTDVVDKLCKDTAKLSFRLIVAGITSAGVGGLVVGIGFLGVYLFGLAFGG